MGLGAGAIGWWSKEMIVRLEGGMQNWQLSEQLPLQKGLHHTDTIRCLPELEFEGGEDYQYS